MGNERLTLEIAAKAIGQESIDRLADSLDRFSAAAENSGKRAASGFSGAGAAAESSTPSIRRLFLAVKDLGEGRSSFATVEAGYFIQSLGGITAAAGFTAVAVAALAYGLSKVNDVVREGGGKMAHAFDGLNSSIATANDELRVTGDRLRNQIAALEGKPQNTLALALDEARVSADKLASSIGKDIDALNELMKKQGIGRINAFFTRRTSTSSDETEITDFTHRMAGIDHTGLTGVRGAKDDESRAAAQKEWNKNALAELDAEAAKFSGLIEQSQMLDKLNNKGFTSQEFKQYTSKYGPVDTTSIDESARLAERRGALDNINEIRDSYTLTTGNDADEKKKNALEASRQLSEEQKRIKTEAEERRRTIEEVGKKALTPIEGIFARSAEISKHFEQMGKPLTRTEQNELDTRTNTDAEARLKQDRLAQAKFPLTLGGRSAYEYAPRPVPHDEDSGDIKRTGELVLADLKQRNEEHNKQINENSAEAVRANAAKGAFSDRMTSLSPELSEAQKIAAIHQQDLDTARQKFQIELAASSELATQAQRDEALNKANLSNELDLQKIKEDNLEKLAELQNKQIEEFRGLVGGLFDAVASRTPRAVPNFIKDQVLHVGQTVAENVAQEYLPKLQKLLPTSPGGILGTILKGTGLTKDAAANPLKLATDANTAATEANTTALANLRAQAMSPSGGGSGAMPGGGIPGIPDPGGGNYDIYSQAGVDPNYKGTQLSTLGTASAYPGSGSSGLTGNAQLAITAAGLAGAGVMAGMDFARGGASKDLQGAGIVAGMAGTIAKLVAPALTAIPIVGAIAAMALPLIGSFFNGPQQRANGINTELGNAAYNAPQALNVTQDSSGNFTSFDAKGNIRTSNFSAVPTVREGSTWEQTHGLFGGPPTFYQVPGGQTSQFGAANNGTTQPATIVNINAIDQQSFNATVMKYSAGIGNAAAKALQDAHGALTTEVQRAAHA